MTKSTPMWFSEINVNRFLSILLAVAVAAPVVAAEFPKPSLADLIQSGDRKAALARIYAGADVNEAQPDGTRPIHWAVYQVDYEMLGALIARKAKVSVTNNFGSTPISEAANLGDARMVKMLLDAGAEPEGANADGQTALMLALKTGEVPVVDLLLKAGAKVNTVERFHNQTPLMWAAAAPKNGGELVKMLLAKGADVKPRALYSDWDSQISSEPRAQYRPVGGLTALLYAVRDGCLDCVEELLAAGADINLPTPEGVTPLMLAIDNDHNDVARYLLDHGANPNLWDWLGRTALYIAVDRKAALATPARGGRGGRGAGAPGGRAAAREAVTDRDIISALIASGVDLNVALNAHRPSRGGNSGRFIEEFQNTGCTPLMRAAIAADVQVARLLLDKGADANTVAMGLTPFLVAAGVGTGGRGTGLAASTTAGGAGNVALMDALLQHGADINAKVEGTKTYSMRISRAPNAFEGMTALQVAVQTGRVDTVKYLLEKGANTELKDLSGRRAIDLVGTPPGPGRDGQPVAVAPTAAGDGRGGPGRGVSPAVAAQIRTLLESAPKK